jgi:hypothetical protein
MQKNIFLIIDNSKPPERKYLGKVVEYMNIRGVEYKVVSSVEEFEDVSNNTKIIGAISTGSDYRVSTGENIDLSNMSLESLECPGILFHPEEEYQTYSILDRFIERCISSSKNDMKYISKYESFLKKSKHIKMYENFTEKRISIFDQDIKSLLPEEIHIETSYGKYALKRKDMMLNGDLIQIVYHQNTPKQQKGDVTADGEPDYLCIDIYTIKENDGGESNGENLRLNIDITYGDAMVSSFTIESPNKVEPHHYTGIGSMHDSKTKFHFEDSSLDDLIAFFNRFSDKYRLTKDDFKFLDSDPNSYNPY